MESLTETVEIMSHVLLDSVQEVQGGACYHVSALLLFLASAMLLDDPTSLSRRALSLLVGGFLLPPNLSTHD